MNPQLAALDTEIADVYGVVPLRVGQRGRPRGGRNRKPLLGCSSRDPQRDEHIVSMRMAGHTLEDIGAAHGVTRERARQILKRLGYAKTRCLAASLDPIVAMAFARSQYATSLQGVADHFETGVDQVRILFEQLGALVAIRRLFRLRAHQRKESTRDRMVEQVRAFVAVGDSSVLLDEMGTRAGVKKLPDLPSAQHCISAFGSMATFWNRVGVAPRSLGGPGHKEQGVSA